MEKDTQQYHQEEMGYYSFLLRLWQVKQSIGFSWRASLEDPHTSQKRFFFNLDELVEFLQQLDHEKLEIGKDQEDIS